MVLCEWNRKDKGQNNLGKVKDKKGIFSIYLCLCTSLCTKEMKRETFWENLDEYVESFDCRDHTCQLADLNTRVGIRNVTRKIRPFGIEELNENGLN